MVWFSSNFSMKNYNFLFGAKSILVLVWYALLRQVAKNPERCESNVDGSTK